jgi:hypothetical protein
MVLIDIYNSIITVYGDVDDAMESFVTELQSEYTGYTIQYRNDAYSTLAY